MTIHCEIKKFSPSKTVPTVMLDYFFEPIVWGAETIIESVEDCRRQLNKSQQYPEWCEGTTLDYWGKLATIKADLGKVIDQLFALEREFMPTKNAREKARRDYIVFKKRMKAAEEAQRRETTVGDAHEQEKSL